MAYAASSCPAAGMPAAARRDRQDLAATATGGSQAAPAPLLRLTVPGEFGAVRLALSQVMAALAPLGLTRECRDATELVLAEVLNNIVEHAYARCTGLIELDLRLEGQLLACTVRDRGAPMPDGTPPSGRQALLDVPLADLPEGGFGWFLIRSLTRNIHYTRAADGNRLGFAIPIERGVPPG